MANNSIKASNVADKSWYELCDEESSISSNENHDDNTASQDLQVPNDNHAIVHSDIEQSEFLSNHTPGKDLMNRTQDVKPEEELNIVKEESPWRFSYASVLKNSANKVNISPKTPSKPDLLKQEKIVADGNTSPVKSAKREIFLQEDLSLSSHLDVFHMQSPLKVKSHDEEMASPLKTDRALRGTKRACHPKLSLSEDSVLPDDVLMPSPTKVTRLSSRRQREPGESPLACKRPKPGTPRALRSSNRTESVEPSPEKFETDEQVLIRRQKQIDYGKNTIGYERYCQLVLKNKRHRRHPHTPPKNLKYSRRAWDGLIRQWRQQLHFWDPPSEGGGNIEDLDLSSMSETSSDTTSQASCSLPATPKESRKSNKFHRTTRSSASESSSIAEDSGCLPLDDEK